MNLLVYENFEDIKNNVFRRYSTCLFDKLFKIDTPDFDTQKEF